MIKRTDIYMIMGDKVTTVEGVTFVALQPITVSPVGVPVTTIDIPIEVLAVDD